MRPGTTRRYAYACVYAADLKFACRMATEDGTGAYTLVCPDDWLQTLISLVLLLYLLLCSLIGHLPTVLAPIHLSEPSLGPEAPVRRIVAPFVSPACADGLVCVAGDTFGVVALDR